MKASRQGQPPREMGGAGLTLPKAITVGALFLEIFVPSMGAKISVSGPCFYWVGFCPQKQHNSTSSLYHTTDFQTLEDNFCSPHPLKATTFVLLAKFSSSTHDRDSVVLFSLVGLGVPDSLKKCPATNKILRSLMTSAVHHIM